MKALGNWQMTLFAGVFAFAALACPKPEPAVDPSITTFSASPEAITDGESSTLSWETLHAVSISIVDTDGNAVDVSAANVGSGSVSVSPSSSTEYTLTAVGGDGTTAATAKAPITVAPADVCGDGSVTGTEACDDGNTADGDYCSSDCSAVTGSCGDSSVQSNETCDDGNSVDNDYCAADCMTETGSCGDSVTQTNEACDDGNTVDGDYCSADCQTQNGACGDGTVESFEICDDGNTMDGDYCAGDCQSVTGSCGDGTTQSNELCDDGNTVDGDYCAADCLSIIGSCGDSTLQSNEVCDDGNTVDGDYCAGDCQSVTGSCGDGTTQSNELCDDGNTVVGDYCAADCLSIIGSCGDSTLQSNEVCDDGNTVGADGCRADCMGLEVCGDTLLDTDAGEVCDDGNTVGGDACRADCLGIEVCGDTLLDVDAGETCDDGNTVDGDGCSASCQIEGGSCAAPYDLNTLGAVGDGSFSWSSDTTLFSATLNASCASSGNNPEAFASFTAPTDGSYFINQVSPTWDSVVWVWDANCDPTSTELACVDNGGQGGESLSVTLVAGQQIFIVVDGYGNFSTNGGAFDLIVAPEICGDGMIVNAETCDDGNAVAGDGCDASCKLEAGYTCPTPAAACRAIICGDGFVDAPEGCDDGNAVAGDGCDATCVIEAGYVCPTPAAACRAITCGDGFVDAPEVCDDGNTTALDGCDATCVLEPGFACPTPAVACHAITCGDGFVDAPETCDDGNTVAGDGCGATCMLEGGSCGDSYDLNNNGLQPDGSWLWQSDTTNFTADYNASCTTSGNNPDAVASFVAPSAGSYLVTLDGSFNTVLWVWDAACAATPTDLACSNGSSSAPETAVLTLGVGEAVNIVVDGYGNFTANQGSYSLSVEQIVCGDGVVTPGVESCDDGNTTAGDGCSASCQVEGGYDCPSAGVACTYVCGNGTVDASESCDDGNTASLDGCSAACQMEAGFTCDTVAVPTTCVSWALPAAAGDLVISEVMQNPASVSDSKGEWFEIHNPTTTDLQLMGAVFQDDATTTETFTVMTPVGVPAGGYAVFSANGDSATNGGLPVVDYAYPAFGTPGGFSLGNGSDGIQLFASDATTLIDAVIWDNGATFPDPSGFSMALISGSDATANDLGSNWCEGKTTFGLGDHGTPGAPNPGYDCATFYEGFESWPATGWTVIDDNGAGTADGLTWGQCSAGSHPFAGGAGNYICVDSDAAGNGVTMNETLISPIYDTSTATTVTLGFTQYARMLTSDSALVEISVDGGVTWSQVANYRVGTNNPSTEAIDISALAAGQATLQVRFVYGDGGSWDWYWLIDDFTITAN